MADPFADFWLRQRAAHLHHRVRKIRRDLINLLNLPSECCDPLCDLPFLHRALYGIAITNLTTQYLNEYREYSAFAQVVVHSLVLPPEELNFILAIVTSDVTELGSDIASLFHIESSWNNYCETLKRIFPLQFLLEEATESDRIIRHKRRNHYLPACNCRGHLLLRVFYGRH